MEYFDVYNEDGSLTGEKVERSVAHEKGILHGAVHIYLYRKSEKGYDILVQKRADDKDSFPSCWDTSCAGHVTSGDTFEETVVKELKEELGVNVTAGEAKHCFTKIVTKINTFYNKVFNDHEIYKVYKLECDAPVESFNFQREEISQLKWIDSEELLERLIANDKDYCIMLDTYREVLEYIKKCDDSHFNTLSPFAVPDFVHSHTLVQNRPRHSSACSLHPPQEALTLDSLNLEGIKVHFLFISEITTEKL